MKATIQRGLARGESGISLIATAFLIIVLGLSITVAARFYTIWNDFRTRTESENRLDAIQLALSAHLAEYGRYPCPAPLNAALDSPEFGVEANCAPAASVQAGTFQTAGRDGRLVRTGGVPARTLGIPDEFAADGYRHRFVYAVTEAYAYVDAANPLPTTDEGAIYVRDPEGHPATGVDGNLVQTVYSMGWDTNGAYGVSGDLIEPCDPSLASGENCNFNADAIFINTLAKSGNEDDPFQMKISYRPTNIIASCDEPLTPPPRDVAYLMDTSGSMFDPVDTCPEAIGSPCTRIDIAHWAMRRLIPARLAANSRIAGSPDLSAGTTSMTGFKPGTDNPQTTAEFVDQRMGNIVIDNPADPNYQAPDLEKVSDELEGTLQNMCPRGYTPLGVHIDALAQRLKGGSETQPNKIVVISDGISNRGENPASVAQRIAQQYPNLKVDVIDVTGDNQWLKDVSRLTGGSYYNPQSADEFLDALLNASGICGALDNPPEPDDPRHCVP